jgi:formylglycine-generating enzyme required for sulfatase activity
MAGNVNNWVADWYWQEFGRFCVRVGLLTNPSLDDALVAQYGFDVHNQKADRGGGYATPLEHHEVLGCTRKVHWTPETREPWNGFRTARSTR